MLLNDKYYYLYNYIIYQIIFSSFSYNSQLYHNKNIYLAQTQAIILQSATALFKKKKQFIQLFKDNNT